MAETKQLFIFNPIISNENKNHLFPCMLHVRNSEYSQWTNTLETGKRHFDNAVDE